jgi:hypothetical protein
LPQQNQKRESTWAWARTTANINNTCNNALPPAADASGYPAPAGELAYRRVEETFRRQGLTWEVVVDGQVLRTTGEHPFYVRGRGWVAARELQPGDELRSHDGRWLPIEGVRNTGREEVVYNCRVAEYHTYFVGDQEWGFSIWSHNSACVPGGAGAAGQRFTPDQDALVQLAKELKRTGVRAEDVPILRQWAQEYGLPFRGPEIHNREVVRFLHIHIGPVNHIPVTIGR